MRGTIVRRGQKFYAVLDLPPGENGKRRQKWLSGFDTRRDAEAALAETLTEVHTGRYVEPATMTVRQFLCDEWLPASTARVRATTLRGYRQAIYSYAVPALGDVPLADDNPGGADEALRPAADVWSRQRQGRPLSPHRSPSAHDSAPRLRRRRALALPHVEPG